MRNESSRKAKGIQPLWFYAWLLFKKGMIKGTIKGIINEERSTMELNSIRRYGYGEYLCAQQSGPLFVTDCFKMIKVQACRQSGNGSPFLNHCQPANRQESMYSLTF
jgi:hypothetical protein